MKKVVLVIALALVVILAACQPTQKPVVIKTEGGTVTLDQLGKTLPGFGVLMHRVGLRITNTFYAAQAGNWDLAEYELEEMKEDFQTGQITRPERKQAVQTFLDGAFAKLEKATKAKKFNDFKTVFDNTVKACNGCHTSSDKPFIQYQLPAAPIDVLNLQAK